MSEKVAQKSLTVGDHGSTYGGNPLACAAVCEVLRQFEALDITGHVRDLTPYLEQKLDQIKDAHPFIAERRGKGFLQGLELNGVAAAEVVKKAQDRGLFLITAEHNTLRFLPPLVIEREHIDEMAQILDGVLGEFSI